MSLSHRSPEVSLAGIQQDLLHALAGTNVFGGHVAEIYVYRLKDVAPDTEPGATLYRICFEFAMEHNADIRIEVNDPEWTDGRPIGDWLINVPNDHRWHVQVRPKEAPPKEEEEEGEKHPRVTVLDLLQLAEHIDKIYLYASSNLQGREVCEHLHEMRGPLVVAIGKLTILEAKARAKESKG